MAKALYKDGYCWIEFDDPWDTAILTDYIEGIPWLIGRL